MLRSSLRSWTKTCLIAGLRWRTQRRPEVFEWRENRLSVGGSYLDLWGFIKLSLSLFSVLIAPFHSGERNVDCILSRRTCSGWCWLWLFLVVTKPLHRTFSGWQRAQNFAYHCQTLNLKERFIVTKSSSFLPSPLENKRSELHLANWLLQTSCQQRRPRKSSWIFNTRSFTLLYTSVNPKMISIVCTNLESLSQRWNWYSIRRNDKLRFQGGFLDYF